MGQQPVILIGIADDHPPVRAGLKSLINDMDFGGNVIIEAGDGRELLDKIARSSCQPDICLLDISMDGMDGYETMQQITKLYPAMHGIAISLHEDEYHIFKMMQNGAKGYLSKKTNATELKKAILTVYGGEVYFSGHIKEKYPELVKLKLKDLAKKMPNEKEAQFLELCTTDKSYKEIAAEMNISQRTAEHYATRLEDKLSLHSRAGLAMYSVVAGIGKLMRKGINRAK